MELSIVREPDQALLTQAAQLHYESLSYRSFITLFGQDFLIRIYKALLDEKIGFMIPAMEAGALMGFLLVCEDSDKLSKAIFRRAWKFIPDVSRVIIRQPKLLRKVLESLLYSSRQKSDPKPELLIIAVNKNYRSNGIGTKLLSLMEEQLVKNGYRGYKVTVHQAMERSIHFYQRNKMRFSKNFELYGYPWCLFVKELTDKNYDKN